MGGWKKLGERRYGIFAKNQSRVDFRLGFFIFCRGEGLTFMNQRRFIGPASTLSFHAVRARVKSSVRYRNEIEVARWNMPAPGIFNRIRYNPLRAQR